MTKDWASTILQLRFPVFAVNTHAYRWPTTWKHWYTQPYGYKMVKLYIYNSRPIFFHGLYARVQWLWIDIRIWIKNILQDKKKRGSRSKMSYKPSCFIRNLDDTEHPVWLYVLHKHSLDQTLLVTCTILLIPKAFYLNPTTPAKTLILKWFWDPLVTLHTYSADLIMAIKRVAQSEVKSRKRVLEKHWLENVIFMVLYIKMPRHYLQQTDERMYHILPILLNPSVFWNTIMYYINNSSTLL